MFDAPSASTVPLCINGNLGSVCCFRMTASVFCGQASLRDPEPAFRPEPDLGAEHLDGAPDRIFIALAFEC